MEGVSRGSRRGSSRTRGTRPSRSRVARFEGCGGPTRRSARTSSPRARAAARDSSVWLRVPRPLRATSTRGCGCAARWSSCVTSSVSGTSSPPASSTTSGRGSWRRGPRGAARAPRAALPPSAAAASWARRAANRAAGSSQSASSRAASCAPPCRSRPLSGRASSSARPAPARGPPPRPSSRRRCPCRRRRSPEQRCRLDGTLRRAEESEERERAVDVGLLERCVEVSALAVPIGTVGGRTADVEAGGGRLRQPRARSRPSTTGGSHRRAR